MTVIPLFPLGTVLLPGGSLTLQIFEPRYVALLADLLAAQDEHPPDFGVVAIRRGFEVGEQAAPQLHEVGCLARIRQAADLGDQRYVVVAEGRDRFVLGDLTSHAGKPYLQAEVQLLPETGGELPSLALAGRLREEVAAYRRSLGAEHVESPESSEEVSYWLPDVVELGLEERQSILAAPRTEDRLRLALRIVRRERGLTASLRTRGRPPDGPMSPN
ncbi:MAG TPA: LON peptidase substrate-binding domain-containing protein [Ornithinimicrobium sp.]|uniref:LON peptidase substrate-binding domain-containing protein n=1 Tax=Ornithinimicrobium sp. TaxID=1977084 RepID=UPI002B4A1D7B|nr:LON peptidase substrate-binding domain-containing protein [Ornithinimicrobium sp.]HKJ11510.1 LON peptidase substrate-binding domain-containing protein [Ornithinimicrobium sp.]